MKDKTITAVIILGVCMIISAFIILSGLRSLGNNISDAGAIIGGSIANTNENIIRVE